MENKFAIVGLSCRFPGAMNPEEYWNNLCNGICGVKPVPSSRWSVDEYYSSERLKNKSISRWAGLVDGFDKFDAKYFGFSPREVQLMDPQQRIALELSVQCIEDAGYSVESFKGSNTGVFIGVCNFDYKEELEKRLSSLDGHLSTGTYTTLIPNRISFYLDLKGPSIPVDTACSSSLVALNQAISSIRNGECEAALVGGVSYLFSHTYFVAFSQAGMLSPTGLCKTFDASADGYVRGEGAGVMLVKPLDKALQDNDQIYGIVDSVAVNHGGKVSTITSPSAYAQSRVIVDALKRAKLSPYDISYIEAHGTGTPKGDPIEINALKRAYTSYAKQIGENPKSEYCSIGSVKTNIGHLESASGVAGVIKVLLSIRNKYLPPHLHFSKLNPRIKLDGSPFKITSHGMNWNVSGPRRAGLSSFGFGGVNAHAIVSEYIPSSNKCSSTMTRDPGIFIFSAACNESLDGYSIIILKYLESNSDSAISSVAYSLTRRSEHQYRVAITYSDRIDLLQKLTCFCNGRISSSGLFFGKSDRIEEEVNSCEFDADKLAEAWVQGYNIDWHSVFSHNECRLLMLPPYPFHHKEYFPEELSKKFLVSSEKDAKKTDLWMLTNDSRKVNILSIPLSGIQISKQIVFLMAASNNIEMVMDSAPEYQYCVISEPQSSFTSRDWIEWYWASIGVIREGIKKYNPDNCIFLSCGNQRASKMIFASLQCIDKEFQLPCAWYDLTIESLTQTKSFLSNILNSTPNATTARQVLFSHEIGTIQILEKSIECTKFIYSKSIPNIKSDSILITGGSGGIARVLAKFLVEICGAHVTLVGRSKSEKVQLKEIDNKKGSVEYISADCRNKDDMEYVVSNILKKHGRIDIIMHSAGVVVDKSIFSKTLDDVKNVTEAKIIGCEVLDQVTAELPLKQFIVFSSVTGLFGNPGQSDYAAANAYLSDFIESRNKLISERRRYGAATAIHWPYWKNGGMQIDDSLVQMLEDTMGMTPMTNEQGIEVIKYALINQPAQVCIVPGKRDKILNCLTSKESVNSNCGKRILKSEGVIEEIVSIISSATGLELDEIKENLSFSSMGIDSIIMQAIARDISSSVGLRVTSLQLNQYPSVEKISTFITDELRVTNLVQQKDQKKSESSTFSISNKKNTVSQEVRSEESQLKKESRLGLSLIGMDLKISGHENWQTMWQCFSEKKLIPTSYPLERWEKLPHSLRIGLNRENYKGYFIDDCLTFDYKFFEISKREAMLLDPQHRLMIQSVWRAIESAGYSISEFSKRKTAVFTCLDALDYAEIVGFDSKIDEFSVNASTPYLAANRLSHIFNLQGPSETLNTACASVYVAVERAMDLIERGVVDQAIVAASQLNLLPSRFDMLSQRQLLSFDGVVAPFDKDAHGFVRSEGVGCLILKNPSLAKEDADNILVEVKSAASWHSGRGTSLTSPNAITHLHAMKTAFSTAGLSPSDLKYVEAHGTASQVGDASECEALIELLKNTPNQTPCILSSMKSNVGHLEVCSGIAGFVRSILAIRHDSAPGIPDFKSKNQSIDDERLLVKNICQDLPNNRDNLIGLHAYGLGGVSSFVLLQKTEVSNKFNEHKYIKDKPDKSDWLLLSANDETSLIRLAQELSNELALVRDDSNISSLINVHRYHRDHLNFRLAIKVENSDDLRTKLDNFIKSESQSGVIFTKLLKDRSSNIDVCCKNQEPDLPQYVSNWLIGEFNDELTRPVYRTSWPTYPFDKSTELWVNMK